FTHTTDDHFVATHWCVTGYPGMNNQPSHPSNGSLTSHIRGPNAPGMPAYALLQDTGRRTEIEQCMGTGHLPLRDAPFMVEQDWMRDDFQEDNLRLATSPLKLADDTTLDRIEDRRQLLRDLDRLLRELDAAAGAVSQMDDVHRTALETVVSGKARR